MTSVENFLKANHLKQVELARYLGITEGSVSKMVKGSTQPSKENLRKILENDRGWDTKSLTVPLQQKTEGEIEEMTKEIERLKRQIEELKEDKLRYWGLIMELTKKQ